jgi:hypothetical protein
MGRRRWPRYAAFALVALVAMSGWLVVGWQHLPGVSRTFKVVSKVFIAETPPRLISASPNEIAASQGYFDDYRRAQVALLKSRLVLNAALRHPRVAGLSVVREQADPVEWLEKELQTDFNAAPEILTVSLKGNRPDELMPLVNAVVDAYLQEWVHREDRARTERLSRLQKLYSQFDEQVRDKRRRLSDLARVLGGKDEGAIAVKRQLVKGDLADTRREVCRVDFELVAAQTRLAKLKANAKAGERDAAVAKLEEEVAVLAEQKTILERKRQALAQEAAALLRPDNELDQGNLATEIAQAEDMLKKVGSEQDALQVELLAPPRVGRLEEAVPQSQ